MGLINDAARRQLAWYVRSCLTSPAAHFLEPAAISQLDVLRGETDDADDEFTEPRVINRRRKLRELHRLLCGFGAAPRGDQQFERNIAFARKEFGLDEIDTEILLLLLRYESNPAIEAFVDRVGAELRDTVRMVSALIGTELREIRRRLSPAGALIAGGILTTGDDGFALRDLAGSCGRLQIAEPLKKAMYRAFASRSEWAAQIVGPPLAATLGWDDFAHLGEARDLAARVIAGAVGGKAAGINLMLHGPVGTGKTELAKALAARTGCRIWAICEADDEGGEPSRGERIAALKLAQRLLARHRRALILFDEAEDALAQASPFAGRQRDESKVFVNRLIECNPVPVLWTCNDVQEIDRAVLRRMTLACEIRTPGRPVRERIWGRLLSANAVQIEDGAAARLAARYAAPPAVAANAARAAALAGGGEAEIELAISGVLPLLGIAPQLTQAQERGFDPALVNCGVDLAVLAERLTRPGAPAGWSLCIHGLPGTGKSQFARHLAERLGLEVMQQRASDLLSMWVGGSEKAIAATFAAARAQRAMLIFDEADSLLADRREASHSWEVTQVNEMLTWMESHPLPFVCTTNLPDRLDRAALRRFTLKLRFDPLDPARAACAFRHFFAAEPPGVLPDGLTPGDFATVRRKLALYGDLSPGLLVEWLRKEVEAKGLRAQPIGFVAP